MEEPGSFMNQALSNDEYDDEFEALRFRMEVWEWGRQTGRIYRIAWI